jgi:hypothetical protein
MQSLTYLSGTFLLKVYFLIYASLVQEEAALKDQELVNALADTDYVKAIQLAFELRRPYKLLNVFTELYAENVISVNEMLAPR